MAYSFARSERENIGVSRRDTSPLGLGAIRHKDTGATHMDTSNDYGFGWLDGENSDWEASRRENTPMSRRDHRDGWDVYGATLLDDQGNARRDHLGRKIKDNPGATRRVDLGTTGDTRREDFGVSTRDGLGATAAYSIRDSRYGSSAATHSDRYHREAAGDRLGELGASRPEYMLNTLTEEKSDITLPDYDYTYTRDRPQEPTVGKPRQWTSIAADRQLMNEWHSMFGQIRTKWAPGTDDPVSVSRFSEDRKFRSLEGRRQRIQRLVMISVALAVVALVAVILPTVILTGIKSEDDSEVLVKYEYQATIENEDYIAEMENTSSEAFRNVSYMFCDQLNENAGIQENDTAYNYEGCVVSEIRSGSLIVMFTIVIRTSRRHQPSPQQVIIVIGLVLDGEKDIGGFKVRTVIVFTQQIEITEDENPVPKKVAFNSACSANQRCKTTEAKCTGGICTCPVNRYYEETPDKCSPIQCGNAPTVDHGEVTTTGNNYGSTLAVECNSGYDISDNVTVSCATHGSWGTIPGCNPIECAEFVIPSNANDVANSTGRTFNESILISCNDGFEIDGSSAFVTCRSDKSWSSPPHCNRVSCSTYNIPDKAVVTSSNSDATSFNHTIAMRCENGYEIDGEETVTCQANKTWSISPSCNPLVCYYSPPEHGSLSNNATTEAEYNETIPVNVQCSSGYEPEGETNITCQASANFTEGPTCKPITCKYFVIPNHTTVDSDIIGRIFSDVINITCDEGYALDGVDAISKVICQADTTWSESGTCIPVVCMMFDIPEHATIVSNAQQEYVYNETITVECDKGYELDSEGRVSCQADTTWTASPVCNPIVCEEFVTPANAELESKTNDHSFNDTVIIKCNEGFKLDGASSVTCQANSSWSPTPSCNRVECSMFIVPENADIVSSDPAVRAFNDTITMNCNEGYKLVGPDTVTCQANETWTGSPSCNPVFCDQYDPPKHGTVSQCDCNASFNETITLAITCDNGFEVVGEVTITCQANKSFTAGPTCEPVTCIKFDTPEHAALDSATDERIFNDTITITCDDGYDMAGDPVVTCQGNKTWTTSPICNRINCSVFVAPDNADEVSDDEDARYFNDSIQLQCRNGYELDGEEIVTCQANGQWTESPSCIPVNCSTFKPPSNGIVDTEYHVGTSYGQNITVKCNDGYLITGPSTEYCQANGTWSESSICQIISCGSIDTPTNSDVAYNGKEFGDTVNITCHLGYELNGPFQVQCQSNGTWENAGSCQPIMCNDFVAPINSNNINRTGIFFENEVSVSCMSGFILVGDSTVTCDSAGSWPDTKCVHVDCNLDGFSKPENGIVANVIEATLALVIQCLEGYELVGNSSVMCTAGNWSESPICEKIDCGDYGPVENGNISTSTGTKYGDTIEIECNQSYKLIGDIPSTCLSNGSWTDKPRCIQIECERFQLPDRAEVPDNINYTVAGTEIMLSCFDGYNIVGSENVVCLSNGTWTSAPSCKPKDCGKPDEIANSNVVVVNTTTFNNSFVVVCQIGYTLQNKSTVTCQSNGIWSQFPTCEMVSCGNASTPDNAKVTMDEGYNYGSNVSFACVEGFTITGKSIITCQQNKTWTESPVCEIEDCGDLNEIGNGTVVNQTGTTFGSITYIQCNEDFSIIGNGNVTCLATGEWETLPFCQNIDCGQYSPPDHASIDANYTIYCEHGYEIDGVSILECLNNGNWSEVGTCNAVQCDSFPTPDNSSTSADDNLTYVYGDIIEVSCEDGFEISGNAEATCGASKKWENVPTCRKVICINFIVPNNAVIGEQDTSGYVFEDVIFVNCSKGYILSGNKFAKCGANKEWENIPICEAIPCDKFAIPTNATIGEQNTTGHVFGDKILVNCLNGFDVVGDSEVGCGTSGEWENMPSCTPKSCPDFSIPTDATIGSQGVAGYVYEQSIDVSCNIGFNISGDSVVTCGANGTWESYPSCVAIRCSDIPVSDNVVIDSNSPSFTFGNVVKLSCKTGYNISGSSEVNCTADGSWTEIPSCDAVPCPTFPLPDNASIGDQDLGGYTYGDVINITCKTGHASSVGLQSNCGSDGEWENIPSCDTLACPVFPTPDNATINDQHPENNTVGDKINISCNDGFVIDGNPEVVCRDEGNTIDWIDIPVCSPAPCVKFTIPANATIGIQNTTGYVYGDDITVSCLDGFNISGNPQAKCGANKEWENIPICEAIPCDKFAIPTNATIGEQNTTGHVFGDKILVNCLNGFDVVGDSEVGCGTSGEWENMPSCTPKSCPDFSIPTDATIGSQGVAGYVYEQSIDVSCNIGFNISGDSVVTCGANGTWESYPSCVAIRCADIPVSDNVVIDSNFPSFTFGNVVKLSCKTGYNISGSSEVNCTADGSWTEIPSCDAVPCPTFPLPDNASIGDQDLGGYTYGDVINITCKTGHASSVGLQSNCGSDGEWENIPSCDPLACPVFPTPDNATINDQHPENNTVGDKINISCNDGFVIDGNPEVVCRDEGNTIDWIDIPVCSPAPCVKFTIPANATIGIQNTTGYVYGDDITVSCLDGFNISGNPQAKCGANKEWENIPICEAIPCDKFAIPTNATIGEQNTTGHVFGDKILVNCLNGFDVVGDSEVGCGTSGEWENMPSCTPKSCPDFSIPTDATIGSQGVAGYVYEQSIDVSCNIGFNISGDSVVTCGANGTWESYPSCVAIRCADIPVSDNVVIDSNFPSFTFGNVVKLSCKTGYNISGSSEVNCTADGSWTEIPSCDAVPCPTFPLPDNASIGDQDLGGYTYGDVINITCKTGHASSVGLQSNCGSDGEWENIPSCDPLACPVFPTPDNATINDQHPENNTVGDKINVSCNDGFVIDGNPEVVCRDEGNTIDWIDIPVCSPAPCVKFMIPANATIGIQNTTGYVYGDDITVSCLDGFNISGNPQAKCGSDGNWTSDATCESVNCKNVPVLNNGSYFTQATEFEFGDTVNVVCDDGFNNTGDAEIKCGNDSQWNGDPLCEPVTCPRYIFPDNVAIVNQSADVFMSGHTLIVKCIEGFNTSDGTTVECSINGTWGVSPTCSPVMCVNFSIPNNSTIDADQVSNHAYKEVLNVTCNDGYILLGNALVECRSDGYWSESPVCDPVECLKFVAPPNGSVSTHSNDNNIYGENISITCNLGFEISGVDWVTCQANSTWSPSPVCSPVQCGDFYASVANGNVTSVTGTEYTDVVSIECNIGFILIGSSKIMCQANGKWEPHPICNESQCGTVDINNGTIDPSNSSILTIVCDAGFVLNGTDTIICEEDGNWTAIPTCEAILCERYVGPLNGNVSYTDNIFGSSVSIICNNGYEVNGNDTALCMEDGKWSGNISCDPIDCGPYDVPSPYTHYVDTKASTTYNSTLPVTCVSGLEHTNASATMVTCEADGMWSGEPDCAILGSVLFTENNYNFVEGNLKMITCEVTNYPTWQTVVLAKVDMPNNAQNNALNIISMLIFRISNINGSLENTTFNNNYTIDTTFREDGVSLDILFDPITCDDEGEYICSALVGDIDNPADAEYSNTTVTISIDSLAPVIILPDKIYLGKEASVECIADIGKGEDGEPTGQLILEARFGGNGSFFSINTSEPLVEKVCHFTSTISFPISTDNPMEGVVVRCLIVQLDGSRLMSEEKTFDILSSYVAFENSSYIFNIGKNASLTCDIENIPDWTYIEIRRPNGDVSIRVNNSDTSEHYSDAHISLNAASSVTNDSARLIIDFNPVRCIDSVGEIETVEYTCIVATTNSTTESTTSITFQKPPMQPELTMSRQIVEAQPTWGGRTFHCEGEVGNPEGHIEVESNFGGEFNRLLANFPGENKTSYGFIVDGSYTIMSSDECGYRHAFEFALENITVDYMHLKNLRCVTKPAADLDNGMTLYSEEKPVKVVPVTYCKGSTDKFKPHPFFCNYAITCYADRTVEGVPDPCDIDQCFDTSGGTDNGCKSCDSIGGCSVQVIQCDKTSIASYKGDSVEFTCNTQDVGEVTYISINSPIAANIDTQNDSIQIGEGVDITISQHNVILRFINVSCDEEGDYIIRVNNQTEVTLTLSVISDPGQPDIFIPAIMAVNTDMQANCSGLVGRDDDGKNKATIFLEVKFEGINEYVLYNNGDGMRTEAEADCDISEVVIFDITPDLSWNNSVIRCVTQTDPQDVVYSFRESILLQVPDIYCEPVSIYTNTGASAVFNCVLKDISKIESLVVSRNNTDLIVEGEISLPYESNQDFTLTIPSIDGFVVNFTEVKCADEGEYVITINNVSSTSVTLRIVSDPDEPSLNKPSMGTVNQLFEMSCSGLVGRDIHGDTATAMYMEVKFANESEFSIYPDVMQESVSYSNCQYTEIIRLELYPDASWNDSEVRCVTRNDTDIVTSTGNQKVLLHSANTYFEKTDTLAFVGETYLFACIVEQMPDLSDIVISKGMNKAVVASYASNTVIDGVEIIADGSSVVNDTGVLKINMTVQCGDGGDYYCSSVGTGGTSEDVLSLDVQWKALTPVLDPSSDMVENSSAWSGLGFETRCSAELGYANASVYFESNLNGEFQRIAESIVSPPEYNLDTCSNTATIKFDNLYTAAWNGTIIRCVVETADELLMDAEYATVVPETHCDGYSTGTVLPHPSDCRALFTCGTRITSRRPNLNCDVDECYDTSDNSKCVPCADYSSCRPDPLDALPPGTPYLTCSESTGWMGSEASINCSLSNSMIADLANAMVTVLNASGQIFDSTTESPVSSTASEVTFSIQGGISVSIRQTHVEIQFSPVQCYHEGDYTVIYNGTSGLQDTGMLTVQSAHAAPVISKEPANYYRGQEMIITCGGSTGKPEGDLVLKYRTSAEGPYSTVTVEPEFQEFHEQECTYIKNITYSFFVESSMEGLEYVCETTSHNGSTSTSETETVSIESPAVYFVSYDDTAMLGVSVTIQCVLVYNDGQGGVLLSRSSTTSDTTTELCRTNSTGDVMCLDGYTGVVNDEGTNRTVSVTIESVSCLDEGIYYCEPLGDVGLRSRMDLKVTRSLTTPVLNLPLDNVAIAGVQINNGDPVKCIGDAGYPADGKQLKVQFRKNGTAAFEDFGIENASESCSDNVTIVSKSGNIFDTDMDEAEFRCGLFANGSDSPIQTSNSETLRVIKNNCPANSELYTYQYHPFNCHKYIWCFSNGGIAIQTCAGAGCPNITEITNPNCNLNHCSICTMS